MTKRRTLTHIVISLCGVTAFIGFIALGNWQVERRAWKLDLIQKLDDRVHAPATSAPSVSNGATANMEQHEYRHISLSGKFIPHHDTLVVTATELGSGYWVLSPFQRKNGDIVFINRGFIGQGITPTPPPTEEVQLTGLLRLNEPKGSVLRDNIPAQGRWYSRDVTAMATTLGFTAAPYFIDAAQGEPGSPGTKTDATGNADPVGGLTVIQFHNNHFVYALTWYGLALMVLGAAVIVRREQHRR
ncbi:MAG: SURF1 family protein [Spongiibacteraceae bacterium]